jgi:hypothetical protein
LSDTAIARDDKWMETLDSDYKKKRSRLTSFFSEKKDYHLYRKALAQSDTPCIPYIDLLLSDLFSLSLAQSEEYERPCVVGMIDFRRRVAFAGWMESFFALQKEYDFDPIPCIHVCLSFSV